MAVARQYLIYLLVVLISGCIPRSSETFELGTGYTEVELKQVEETIERLGYERVWHEPEIGKRLPYYFGNDGDEIIAGFRLKFDESFGITVYFRKRDGLLRVQFIEDDISFSAKGRELSLKLSSELRRLFENPGQTPIDPGSRRHSSERMLVSTR